MSKALAGRQKRVVGVYAHPNSGARPVAHGKQAQMKTLESQDDRRIPSILFNPTWPCASAWVPKLKVVLPLMMALAWLPSAAPAASKTVADCDQAHLESALAGGGTVTFDCDGTITLSNTITIAADTVLDASGRAVTISGNGAVRVFQVNTGVTFTAIHLTVADGFHMGPSAVSGAGGDGRGAGLLNLGGTVVLRDCVLTNHSVLGGTGATFADSGGQGLGAAICNLGGQLSLTNCIVSDNRATGGSPPPPAHIVGNGAGGAALGGAIYCEGGGVAIDQGSFAENGATGGNAGGQIFGNFGAEGPAQGGAIYANNSTVVIKSAFFQTNSVTGASSPWSGDGAGAARGGAVALEVGTAEVSDSVFTGNAATGGNSGRRASGGEGAGGAIYNAAESQVARCRFTGNHCLGGWSFAPGRGLGGAVYSVSDLILNACTLDDNEAQGGAGIAVSMNAFNGTNGCGGAIATAGNLGATNVTVVSNRALGGSGNVGISPSLGGAGQGGGICVIAGSASLAYATLARNLARGGAGFFATNSGPAQGGGVAGVGGTLRLASSIVAFSSSGGNCFGPIIDGGHNISTDSSCNFSGPGSFNSTDPVLGPLGDYGGATLTMPLLAGSPAINAADGTACPPTDQRGIARPFGPGCDIGAFESAPPYTIRGRVHGFGIAGGISVSSGALSTLTGADGNYRLDGLKAGSYSVAPSAAGVVFVPASTSVTVGPDELSINFNAYWLNALVVEEITNNLMHFVFAGTNGKTYRVQSTTNFVQWESFSTNTVGTNGIFEFFDSLTPSHSTRFFRAIRP